MTPETDEAFLREVDDELRREQLGTFWRRYGRLLIAAIVIGLVVFGGYLWWQAEKQKQAGLAGEQLTTALDALGKDKLAEADKGFAVLAKSDSPGYRAAARLAQAALLLQKGDVAGAAKAYDAIAADQSLPQPFRDIATIRGTSAQFDGLPPAKVIDRLKPLAMPGSPWFGSAGEMTAIAWLKMGRTDRAGLLFEQLAQDSQVPASIAARAKRIAGALGADSGADVATAGKEQ